MRFWEHITKYFPNDIRTKNRHKQYYSLKTFQTKLNKMLKNFVVNVPSCIQILIDNIPFVQKIFFGPHHVLECSFWNEKMNSSMIWLLCEPQHHFSSNPNLTNSNTFIHSSSTLLYRIIIYLLMLATVLKIC